MIRLLMMALRVEEGLMVGWFKDRMFDVLSSLRYYVAISHLVKLNFPLPTAVTL